MTREQKIQKGKIWQVYWDKNSDNIIFEDCKTRCFEFVKRTFGMRQYKGGKIRVGQLIWEKEPKNH